MRRRVVVVDRAGVVEFREVRSSLFFFFLSLPLFRQSPSSQ